MDFLSYVMGKKHGDSVGGGGGTSVGNVRGWMNTMTKEEFNATSDELVWVSDITPTFEELKANGMFFEVSDESDATTIANIMNLRTHKGLIYAEEDGIGITAFLSDDDTELFFILYSDSEFGKAGLYVNRSNLFIAPGFWDEVDWKRRCCYLIY